MLANVEAVVGPEAAASWKRLLNGLWHSGLRLSEALALYWERDDTAGGKCLEVDLSGRRPMLRIPADLDKGNKDRLLPIAPEFAEFLLATPEADRTGPVFLLKRRRVRYDGNMRLIHVSKIISTVGHKAGVKVNADTGKCASAHDLAGRSANAGRLASCRKSSCSSCGMKTYQHDDEVLRGQGSRSDGRRAMGGDCAEGRTR